MLFPAIFVLFAVTAAIDDENVCRTQALINCDAESIPKEIPDTMEDFNRLCKTFRDFMKCMIEENDKCIVKPFDPVDIRKYFQFVETNCDKDSSLYQALSRNYECIQLVAKNMSDECKPYEEEWDALKDDLESKVEELSESIRFCPALLYYITCTAHIFGMHCGQESKETVAEILRNMYSKDLQICNEESALRELQPVKEIFQSYFNKTLEVENVTVKGTAAIDEKNVCRTQALMKCDYESNMREIPDTMYDFRINCKTLRDAMECIIEENDKCIVKAYDPVDIRQFFQFVENNCDEDSSLYQALSRNYECIQPLAKNLGDQCKLSDEDWRVLVDNLKPKVRELSPSIRDCPHLLYEITCKAHIVGLHCGQESKETVTVIMRNMDMDFLNCNKESILRELQPLKELFESYFNENLDVENATVKGTSSQGYKGKSSPPKTAIDDERECRAQVFMKCHAERIPVEMPDTMEDFKRDCETLRDVFKCIIEENDKCIVKYLDPVEYRKWFQFVETNCDEDSSLYQALSRNYECIQPIAKSLGDQCKLSDEDWKVLVDNLKPKVGELSESIRYCPNPLYEITCPAYIIGMHCGEESKETVTEILRNMDLNFLNCNEESILRELQPLKELFESLFNGTLVVEDVIVKELEERLVESLNISYYLIPK